MADQEIAITVPEENAAEALELNTYIDGTTAAITIIDSQGNVGSSEFAISKGELTNAAYARENARKALFNLWRAGKKNKASTEHRAVLEGITYPDDEVSEDLVT